ncbi:signal recognition particle-docking protein FtsY [Ignisphaera sp. 4213-co]|uniref:Signal recognition particle receptor FtsY n=1 Tax=Ignisphaera cupida TaxID=3050454 RepID=A0ABD4Z6H2_9CREN|nr:signal recognition particle-docking protein FtsY [Ignisphaera sp. 4213-co]MDK6028528.1 signal recognition particle-docking protein FtsY [Ignisphaera sp. 4213-co]
MFSKIKKVLQDFAQQISEAILYRTLSEKEIDEYCNNLFIQLIESDVAYDVAEKIVNEIKQQLMGKKIRRGDDAKNYIDTAVEKSLEEMLKGVGTFKLMNFVKSVLAKEKPVKIMFMGVNGVGKTTTIAKIAHILKTNGFKVVVAAADTFRAGAQEQLKKHAERIGVTFIGGRYGSDPAAIAFDAIVYAQKNNFDVVLIDTAGRMHVDIDLMNELRKVARVVKPHLKLLVLDALTGNDALEQLKGFEEAVGVDVVVLTKVDADANGGAALTTIIGVGKPIAYLGVGQGYNDLIEYDPAIVLKMLFR